MAKIEGFGLWEILNNDEDKGILLMSYGIIDINKRLFIETDSNANHSGKVINLNYCGGWRFISKEEQEKEGYSVY